jgi:hypothetical protein
VQSRNFYFQKTVNRGHRLFLNCVTVREKGCAGTVSPRDPAREANASNLRRPPTAPQTHPDFLVDGGEVSRMPNEPQKRGISFDDVAIGHAGDLLAKRIKRLCVDAERPTLMMMFLYNAIEQYASIIADGDPDAIAARIKIFKGDANGGYVACAKHILLQREADYRAAEDDDDTG